MTSAEGLLAQNGGAAANFNTSAKYDVNDIVMHFGREYYTMLSCEPERLHCFYGKQSSLLHCHEQETDATVCLGLEEIHQRLVAMGYNGARVVIGNIDCQPSMNGGILIFVLGTMHWPSGIIRKFTQTFLLAEQPNGYFVLNDIMRILSEVETKTVEKKVVSKLVTVETTPEPMLASQIQSSQPYSVVTASTFEEAKATEVIKEKLLPEAQPKPAEQKRQPPTLSTPKKAEQPSESATTPSSWAKVAGVQKNRWQFGVVAESKGPVASIAVEGEKPVTGGNNRVTYRTQQHDRRERRDSRGEQQSQQPHQQQHQHQHQHQRQQHQPKRQSVEYDSTKAIYAHSIAGRIDRDQLRKKFEEFGPLKSYEAVLSKGIAFVEFETVEARNTIMKTPVVYNDSTMTIEPRKPGRKDPQTMPREGTAPRRQSNRNGSQQ